MICMYSDGGQKKREENFNMENDHLDGRKDGIFLYISYENVAVLWT
jgi:hypothetical protein